MPGLSLCHECWCCPEQRFAASHPSAGHGSWAAGWALAWCTRFTDFLTAWCAFRVALWPLEECSDTSGFFPMLSAIFPQGNILLRGRGRSFHVLHHSKQGMPAPRGPECCRRIPQREGQRS